MNMQAVRLHGIKDLRIDTVNTPSHPPPKHVLLKLLAAGICGSDLHNYQTGSWVTRLPVIPGHEYCAEVVACGSGVVDFSVGDRVVVDSRVGCGTCSACRQGKVNICPNLGFVGEVCDGGFAPWNIQPEARLIHVPSGIPPTIAALSEPLGVALHVIERLAPPPDEPILIAGGGTIGGLIALLLSQHHLGPVYLAERQTLRLQQLVQTCGVIPYDIDTKEPSTTSDNREIRYAIEATGSYPALQKLLNSVSGGSRIALVGLFHGSDELNLNSLIEHEIDLISCSAFEHEQHRATTLLGQLASQLEQLTDQPIPLSRVPERYDELIKHGRSKLKSIVIPDSTEE